MDNLYQPVGAFYLNGSCDFNLWAPLKDKIELVVSYPFQKEFPMQKDEAGYWKITLPDVQPGLRYKFRIDGELERPDPASLSQPEGVHKASEVIDRQFDWTDGNWQWHSFV